MSKRTTIRRSFVLRVEPLEDRTCLDGTFGPVAPIPPAGAVPMIDVEMIQLDLAGGNRTGGTGPLQNPGPAQGEAQPRTTTQVIDWGPWEGKDGARRRKGTVYEEQPAPPGGHGPVDRKPVGSAEQQETKNGDTTTTRTVVIKPEKDRTLVTITEKREIDGHEGGVTDTTEWKFEGGKWSKKIGGEWKEQKSGPAGVTLPGK